MPSLGTAVSIFSATLSAGATGFAAAGAALSYFASTFAGKLLVGAALSVAGQLLQGRPEGVKPSGIQTEQTTTGDTTPQKFVVGTYALEGHAVAPAYSRRKKNTILTYILEVSNIPGVELTDRIAINGEWATISGSAPVGRNGVETAKALPEFQENEGTLRDHAWLWFEDGTQTAAHPHLVANYADDPDRPWTEDHKLLKSAYAILEFVRDEDLFSSLPSVRFEVKGIPLYDPREDDTVGGSGSQRWGDSSTWTYTDNPQVINYNLLRGITLPTGDIYGGEVPAEDLPLDNWFAAMNECDVLIGSRKQYTAGFEIDTNEMRPLDVIREMNKASFAQMAEFGGIYRVRVGALAASVMSFTDDDFVITEASSYEPFPSITDTKNFITGTYPEPESVWESASADPISNAEWEVEDGDRRLAMNMDLPAVSNNSQVQQLLTAYINDRRRFRSHDFALPPVFARAELLDTLDWTSDTNGYTAKPFEIMEVEDRPNTMIQRVRVRERDSGDVAWTSGDDVAPPVSYVELTPPGDLVPTLGIPADLVTSDIRVIREAVQNVISITVTSSRPEQVPRVEVQYKEDGATEWKALGSGNLGVYELIGPDNGDYIFRARTFGIEGKAGGWTESTVIATQSTFGNPEDVEGLVAEVNGGTTLLEWDEVTNDDLSFYRVRHAVETTGATWSDATSVVSKVARPAVSVPVSTRPGTYMIKAYDKTGLSSVNATSVVVTADDVPSFSTTLSDAEHTSFPGTKTGVEVNSSRLEITDPSSAPSEGTYDFDGYIETGDSTARLCRCRIDVKVFRKDESSGGWDNISGTWDQFEGEWDTWTGGQIIADTNVQFFIRTTEDDPAGTPTWGAWRQFRSGEFWGRAFQFRVTLKSTSDNITPSIGELTAIVEY